MVPSALIQLSNMPLTPNRKINRTALFDLGGSNSQSFDDTAAALSDDDANIEGSISAIWRSVLGVRNFSASDNFFDVGGHSLLAVQAHREIREKLSVPKLSITDIFRSPVLRDFSNRVAELSGKQDDAKSSTGNQGSGPLNEAEEKSELRSSAIERRRAMRARRKV